MSVATLTPASPAKSTPKPVTVAQVKALEGAALDSAVTALRTRYAAADKGETAARAHFEAADIAWQNARVAKVRVAYAASMLTPYKGAANLLAATRYLLTDPTDTPAKRTVSAKSRKNTLRNYVAAGEELQAAGLASRISEPDAEERKIVADVFRDMNKRDKQDAADKEAADKGEGEGATDKGEGEGEGEALTFVDLVAMVARMNSTLDIMAAGSVVISEREASSMADMLAGFTAKLEAYAEGK